MFPKQIGRFEIQDQIGDNERGTVFRAFDPQLQREVALKLLKTQYLYTMTAERLFKEEAEKIRLLNHPAILPVYDYGDEDNRPFLVMPLMPGGNLTDLFKKSAMVWVYPHTTSAAPMYSSPLALEKAVEIFTPLADALDHAAAQGVLHLDIKPNNVLFDQHGHPFLADLGLVQIIDVLTTAKAPITNSGYISPEQVRGRDMDARSQVYSLGAILFEALTGQPLFGGASEMVTSFKHVSEQPRRPRSLRPELSEAVEQVLLQAVEKRPEDRFQSAREMLLMLERAQGGVIPPEMVAQQRAVGTPGAVGTPASQYPVGGTLPPSGGGIAPTGWTFEREPRTARSNMALPMVLVILSVVGVFCVLLASVGIFIFLADSSSTSASATQTAIAIVQSAQAEANAFVTQTTIAQSTQAEATRISVQATTQVGATQTAVQSATLAAEATQAAVQATMTAAEALRSAAIAWPVLIFDSFDDNANNWREEEIDDDEFASISWNVQDGQYIWQTTAKQGFVWRVWPDMSSLANFYISVDVQRTAGSENAQYGIIFRNSEEQNSYYYFEVHETQEFGVYVYDGTSWDTLLSLAPSTAILPGQVNQLEVIGQGDRFLFFINHIYVGEVFDSTLTAGEAGLAIGLPNAGENAVIVFDNFEVTSP